jgi:hypothetical protein
MKLFGIHIGYDSPLWYFGRWEFGVFDEGWLIAKDRIIRFQGRWPTYHTLRPWRRRR